MVTGTIAGRALLNRKCQLKSVVLGGEQQDAPGSDGKRRFPPQERKEKEVRINNASLMYNCHEIPSNLGAMSHTCEKLRSTRSLRQPSGISDRQCRSALIGAESKNHLEAVSWIWSQSC